MNKRDKFWVNKLLGFGCIVLFFTILSLYNIVQFNSSYMQEEREELNIFQKQIEWAVLPYLEKKDYATVQKYCEDFYDEDVKFRIFDRNKKLIASSKGFDSQELISINDNKPRNTDSKLQIYRDSVKNKMIGLVEEIHTSDDLYYLELTISEEDVLKSIIHAQKSICIFFAVCFLMFLSGLIYVLIKLRIPFDKLQDSVIQIANGDLETRIDIPNLDILQELAIAIKKMTQRLKNQIIRLKQLEEYKTDFINNISHEIKTPITAINSAVELIENENSLTSEQDRECLNIISFQVKCINTLVNDILSLAEIEEDKNCEEKDFKRFNLNKTIKNLINYINSPVPINFIYNDSVDFIGDEELLSRAFTNILTNAIKYSNSDKIDILLNKNENNIKIQIKDYGTGIASEHLDRIFERFYRVDKARSRKTGGTGLGLAIVKNIVELHNGKISVESVKGKGSNFIIELTLN